MNPPFDAVAFGGGISRLQEFLPPMVESGFLTDVCVTGWYHPFGLSTEEVYQLSEMPYTGGDGITLRCPCPRCDTGPRSLAVQLHRSVFYCHNCHWSGGFLKLADEFDRWWIDRDRRTKRAHLPDPE